MIGGVCSQSNQHFSLEIFTINQSTAAFHSEAIITLPYSLIAMLRLEVTELHNIRLPICCMCVMLANLTG